MKKDSQRPAINRAERWLGALRHYAPEEEVLIGELALIIGIQDRRNQALD